MKFKLLGLTTVILAAGAGVVVLVGELAGIDPSEPGQAIETKLIKVEGDCPKGSISLKSDGVYSICVIDKEADKQDDEIDSVDSIPTDKRKRLVVCKIDKQIFTRWEYNSKPVEVGCVIAADNVLIDISTNSIESDVEDKLRASCTTCGQDVVDKISAGSWGQCPACLVEKL